MLYDYMVQTFKWNSILSLRLLLSLGALLPFGFYPTLCAQESAAELTRFEFEEPQMGVPFRIVLYAPSSQAANEAAQAAFKRVADLNQIMSDYETDSELNELSRTSGQGKAVHVSDDLWTVLLRADTLARQSGGAFDITVGPVVSLWRRARRTLQMPHPTRLADALKAVGYQKVRLHSEDHTVELLASGMKLDLGGIAKGYALDEEIKVLKSKGVTRALVSGGGDMAISNPPPGQKGWCVEIAPLDITNAPAPRFVRLANAGLATSGDMFQRLEIEGKRYSHIVDPHTGIGLTDHSLVTVIASSCMIADSLSKVVSVLGPEKGVQFIEACPDAEAEVARKPNEQVETRESKGFRRYYDAPQRSRTD
jgi:thiamine biosynthesis lipoprotein